MTVKEILEKMDNFKSEEREKYLGLLLNDLTIVSKRQLMDFQNTWDTSKPFKEFVEAQNKQIRKCIDTEMKIGDVARKAMGLKPLTEDYEVK